MCQPFNKLLSDMNTVILRTQSLHIFLNERSHPRIFAEVLHKTKKAQHNISQCFTIIFNVAPSSIFNVR